MNIWSISISPKENRRLNSLLRNLEIFSVLLLFLCFFDTNLFFLTEIIKAASYGLILFLLILRWKRCVYVGTRDISLLLILGTIIFSYFWSASPEDTLKESKSVVREILLGVYLAAQYNPKQLMRLFAWMFGVAVVMNWIFCAFAIATHQQDIAITMTNNERSWQGLLLFKQYLGRMVMHASVLFLLSAINNKRFSWAMWVGFSLSGVLLFLSKSKTSWVGFLFSFTLLPILKFAWWNYKIRTIIYVIAVLIVGSIAVLVFDNYETIVVDILRKPPDFNGRFVIWDLAIERALKRPWLGYGYAGFWTSSEGIYIFNHTWATLTTATRLHAHNGFIDLFLDFGIIGISLFTINFLALMKRVINLIHLTKTIEAFWMLEFLLLAFLLQITETLTLISNTTTCTIYVSICLSTILWQDSLKIKATKDSY